MEPRGPTRVLVVARRDPLEPIGGSLKRAGYAVRWADSGPAAVRLLERRRPNVVVLQSGYLSSAAAETLSSAATGLRVPLLVLERRENNESIVERVASLTGETISNGVVALPKVQTLVSGALFVDLGRHTALFDGVPLPLTPKEFELLCVLMRHPGRVWSQQQLLDLVWGYDSADPRVVPVHIANLRKKLRNAAPAQSFVETVRGLGYRFTNPLQSTNLPPGDDSQKQHPLTRPAFVGREHELQILQGALENVVKGELRVVVIDGDAGVGKTRLAEEVTTRARGRGLGTYWSTCREIQARPAYEPWLEIMRQWEGEGFIGDLASLLLPEPVETAKTPAEGQRARVRLLERGLDVVRLRAKSGPLFWVMDDLHLADTSTLLALKHMIESLRDVPLMLIVTCRLHDAIRASLLTDVVARIARSDLGLVLSLQPLSLTEVDRFVQLAGCRDATPEWVGEVYRLTEGNPFFLTQLARLLAIQPDLLESVTTTLSSLGRDQGVRCVVLKRLEQLSSECQESLDMAAVLGRDFSPSLVGTALELSPEEVAGRLGEAANSRIVETDERVPGRYRFAHNMFREVIYGRISPRRRAELHAKVANALKHAYRDDLDRHAGELAYHFTEAVPECAEQAVEFSSRAARVAASQCAWEEACSHWRRALSVAELSPQSVQIRDWRFVGQAYENLAMAHRATGEFHKAIDAYEQAARRVPAEERIWQARLKREQTFCLSTAGQHARAEMVLMEAKKILSPVSSRDDPEWWKEWIAIHVERALPPFYNADLDELRSVANEIEEAVAVYGTAKQKAQLDLMRWLIDLRGRRYEATAETIALAQRLSDSFEATNFPEDLKSAEGALAMTMVLSPADRDQGEKHLRRHLELSRQSQDVTFQVRALWALGIWHRLRRDVDGTRTNALQTLSLIGEKPIVSYGGRARGNLSWVAWRTGNTEEAEKLAAAGFEELQSLSPRCAFEWHVRWTLLALGLLDHRWEEAKGHAGAMLDPSQQKMPTDVESALRAFVGGHSTETSVASVAEELVSVAGAYGYL